MRDLHVYAGGAHGARDDRDDAPSVTLTENVGRR
jgi:hypothetical protein